MKIMTSPIRAARLRAEYLENPLGLEEIEPRFFWWVEDPRPGARQHAYRIRCARSADLLAQDRPDLWDTGKRISAEQAHVVYGGAALASRQRVWWDVQLWDADDRSGAVSPAAWFEMGLLAESDWQAQWIGAPLLGTGALRPPAPLLRGAFTAHDTRQARLYISALGIHVASINGSRVTEEWFRPGWTDYRKRVQYQTYDVTHLVKPGVNVLGVALGDGWYCGRVGGHERGELYGQQPALLAQLEVVNADGERQTFATDGSWQWVEGPTRGGDLLDGEDYDARREIAGWNSPGAPEADWRAVQVVHPQEVGRLVASPAQPVRCVEILTPAADPVPVPATWGRRAFVFDLGQNMTGVAQLRIKGPAGATIRLRFAEMLQKDGRLYTENLRSAVATDHYTLRGDPAGETWSPDFTFHGFRYVELSAANRWFDTKQLAAPTRETIRGLALMSDTPATGSFTCDHALLNRLQSNIQWGQRGNFLEVPTDCPQRDERMGWTGDAQVFAPTAACNADVAAFFTKWNRDLDDAQLEGGQIPHVVPNVLDACDSGPGWSDARVVVPWALYEAYGDKRLLERHYPSMMRWLRYLETSSRDGLRCGPWHPGHRGFGDWLALDVEGRSATSQMFIGTASYARILELAEKIATTLGEEADARRFAATRRTAIAAFRREFVTPGGVLTEQTQTAYLMALAWDLLPEEQRPRAVERLTQLFEEKGWHLSTGFLGTPLICPVLTRFGRLDAAYRVLFQTTYPGWLFPVTNGATTMWERWDSWTPDRGFGDVGMNSFNHYAYGAVGKWIYGAIGGIAADTPGYETIRIAPQPGGPLRRASAAYDSIRGRIQAAWIWANGVFELKVSIPANTQALVRLPDGSERRVAAGAHTFRAPLAEV